MTIQLDWLTGCGTALVTPFTNDGAVDTDCLRALVERQITNSVNLLFPCGTTGESATMTVEEDCHVIATTVAVARKYGARVIAGTGSNDTACAIQYTLAAKEMDVDAVLSCSPYYNKPTQEGLFAHFAAIAVAARDLPILLYNVPGRTAGNITAETVIRLANGFDNIVGVKEASGNVSQIMEIIANRPAGFKVFSGDDALALPLIALGADGVVSVCSNQVPNEMVRMVELALDEDWPSARDEHYRLLPLMEANFIEASPAPCKFVMHELSLLEENLRLPLVPVTDKTRGKLREILAATLSRASGMAGA